MAEFTRKELKKIFDAAEIEVPKDVLGQLCDLHTDSSDDAGETIKGLKKDLKKAEQERDDALAKVPKDGEETVSKQAYDDLKTEYDNYKSDVEGKETAAKKSAAVRELLEKAGVSENHLNAVLRVYDMNGVELDKDGNIKDADKHTDGIKKDWADFIPESRQQGANIKTPPANNGGGMTKADIVKIKDPSERRKAISENMELFEKGNDE